MAMFVIAAVASAAPILAIIVVSFASRSEDRAWSLTGPARGPLTALARRIVDFRSEGAWPYPRNRRPLSRPYPQQDSPPLAGQRRAAAVGARQQLAV